MPSIRTSLAHCVLILSLAACGNTVGGGDGTDGNGGPDACVGLECQVVNCAAMGQSPTSLSGTVFAPNGTLPLYGIQVYVPLSDPGPVSDVLACDRCSSSLPGGAVAQATSDESGKFTLSNVPVGDNIPLIITSGKWRRQLTIPRVEQCVDTPLAATETRLPKNKAEGSIPKIAITTGSADALECLIRKLGVEEEMTSSAGNGRVHLYTGNGSTSGPGGAFANATTLWSDVGSLSKYDIVILSCEGGQRPATKPQSTLDAMKAYADAGGRVFASHWHNIWVGGNFQTTGSTLAPAVWTEIATWDRSDGNPGDPVTIDEVSNPKGTAFANWMLNVDGSGPSTQPSPTMRGQITLQSAGRRMTSRTLDLARAERWVYANNAEMSPQNFQFTTPNEVVPDQRCGKVVFSDMHVSADSNPGSTFPNGCSTAPLTPQEKALAFMFFDIASCVGGIF